MNIKLSHIFTAVLFIAALSTPVQAQTVMVRDFQATPFDYGYEEWKDLGSVQTKTTDGVEIKGSAKGGVGAFFNDPVDLSGSKSLEIKIKRGASNSQDSLMLKLVSADGKSSTWNIPLMKDVSDTTFSVVTFDLSKVRGVKDAVDLEIIRQMQIQGTFDPSTHVDFEIASVAGTGTAPPAQPTPPAPAK